MVGSLLVPHIEDLKSPALPIELGGSLSSSRSTASCSIGMHSSSNHSGVSVASALIILLLVALYHRFGLVQTRLCSLVFNGNNKVLNMNEVLANVC